MFSFQRHVNGVRVPSEVAACLEEGYLMVSIEQPGAGQAGDPCAHHGDPLFLVHAVLSVLDTKLKRSSH